jgi:hypothetical protein
MNTTIEKPTRKSRQSTPVTVIVEREFVGDKTITEALLPVIFEDLRQRLEDNRTLDKPLDSA